MATGSKTRYSIELDFTTGKAEQSVKAATDKIKERLNSIAIEANKTKYFEGLSEGSGIKGSIFLKKGRTD